MAYCVKTDVGPFLEELAAGKNIKEVAFDSKRTYGALRRMLIRRAKEVGARNILHLVAIYVRDKEQGVLSGRA